MVMAPLYPVPRFLSAVAAEVDRARELFPDQEERWNADRWHAVLDEEVGEVARVLNEHALGNTSTFVATGDLANELIQTAAMAARMYAALMVQRPEAFLPGGA